MIEKRTYARVGLMGNPSDGFYGRTISSCIDNFYAEVRIDENKSLIIKRHEVFDANEFQSLDDLESKLGRNGYYGGLRLIQATCKRFNQYCREMDIKLDNRNFVVEYNTNIPRQIGLAGSSAIIVSLTKGLMDFYKVTEHDIPSELLPNFVLSVETDELGISAGLQDRVVQCYGGTVYMDFDKSRMQDLGYGIYEHLDSKLVPKLFLAYFNSSGKNSGMIHSSVKDKFNQGDREITEKMKKLAKLTLDAKDALIKGKKDRLGKLMDMNFDLRREIYGDDVIGKDNLKMINTARKMDAPAKFPGSGGAVVGMYEDYEHLIKLEKAYADQGYKFARVEMGGV
ncbi:hypothetical protein GF312_11720 [Candidatus Poribacteria bacterium]|nr:hypothetical protein [Candidatus Poribacteria bacterium]